ncbi:MAG TPA: hemerythrin domain-containing protein [Nitrospirales bacterium]|nr:hemerythrin domain-containing protein [Nitrospirales bacterium]
MALFGLVTSSTGILGMLSEDHRRVESLFEEFKNAENAASRLRIARQAIAELKIHAQIEEELFYPAVRARSSDEKAADMVGEAVEEHHVVKLLISELEGKSGVDDVFKHKFTVLSELVVHHAQEEEKEMFPAAESGDLNLERLGERAAERKRELQKAMTTGIRTPRTGRRRRTRTAARGARGNRVRAQGSGRGRKPAAARKK